MTTEVISSIRSSGGDYTSLISWEAGEQTNLVAADEVAIAECYHDWPSGLNENSITISGWTTDTTRKIIVRPADGNRHSGKLKVGGNYTGFTINVSGYEKYAFLLKVDNVRIEGIAIDITAARGGGILASRTYGDHANNTQIVGNIVNNITKQRGIEFTCAGDTAYIVDNILTNSVDSSGIYVGLRATAYVYNNSAIDCKWGCYVDSNHASANVTLKNNLASGSATACFARGGISGSLSVSNCASSDATADDWGGTGNRVSQTFTFEDEAADDFHLSSSDAGAKGYGADLSGDANYPFNDDIDGDVRSAPWDIGADQIASGGGTTPITSDIALRWNALEAVTADVNLKWDILNAVDSDLLLAWSLLNGVTRDQALSWDILEQLSSDLNITWDVLSALTSVTSDIGLRWSILNAVQTDVQLAWGLLNSTTSDLQLAWDTLNALTAHLDLRWSVLEEINADVDLRWDLQSALSAVTSDIDLRWDVDSALQSVTSDLDIRWSLLQAVVATLDTRWDLLNAVGADMSMRWDIAQAVVAELNTRWDLLNSVTADAALRWDSLEAMQSSLTLRWSIDGEQQLTPITFIKVPAEQRVIKVPFSYRR